MGLSDITNGNPLRYYATPKEFTDGDDFSFQGDINGNAKVVEQYAPAYEDNTNAKAVVEHRYTPSYKITADTLVKTGAGLLHSVVLTCNDAAPTAGSIIIYDNTAESGSELFNHTFTTTPFAPISLLLDYEVTNGIYAGFTTTADVNLFVSFR
jgi:hypothetical protein